MRLPPINDRQFWEDVCTIIIVGLVRAVLWLIKS